jgi:hypothetical protein
VTLTRIDYSAITASAPSRDIVRLQAFLAEELPYVWLDAYVAMLPHQHNVQRTTVDGFEYLWDLSASLVNQGVIRPSAAVDDRLVAAHGMSRRSEARRKSSRLSRRTLGPVEAVDRSQREPYDRGHVIGHVLGGGLDLNIVPQTRALNRGGGWRRMERYCHEHPGTYFFCRLLYAGLSAHPAEIEFGLLKNDGSLWVDTFQNYGRIEELQEFERLYREKIAVLENGGESA